MSPVLAAYVDALESRARMMERKARRLMESNPREAYILIGRARAARHAAETISSVKPEARA